MDINLVVLNVGNSRLAMGVFRAGELILSQRVNCDQPKDWPAAFKQAWSKIGDDLGAAVCGSSVNPSMEPIVEQMVREIADRKVQWVGREIDLPIEVVTESPEQTGVDRVLGVAAALEQLEKACIVVDAGTAVTVNCCNDRGEFVGGAIAPGAKMMLDALHEKTAALPKTDFEIPTQLPGKSTVEAMRVAVYHSIRGMVREVAEAFAEQLGNWPEIIATGGDAEKLFGGWELIHAISPDLVLYGIALAYTEHHIKHGT